MTMRRTRTWWLAAGIAALVGLVAVSAFGDEIQDRMISRLPKIIELKAAGIIGETNQGFLAFVGGQQKEKALVDAENQDRLAAYQRIAREKGTTAQLVGQRRALQIADMAKPGEWLQNKSGKWYRK